MNNENNTPNKLISLLMADLMDCERKIGNISAELTNLGREYGSKTWDLILELEKYNLVPPRKPRQRSEVNDEDIN